MRGLIFLPMLLIVAGAASTHYLYSKYKIKSEIKPIHYSLIVAFSSLILLWIIGSYNVFTKQHLHKTGLAIPVTQIITEIDNQENNTGLQAAIITTDLILTFYLLRDNKTKLLSPYADELLKLFPKKKLIPVSVDDNLIFIKNTPGALLPIKNKLDSYADYLINTGSLFSGPIKFGYDPDYLMKRKFFPSAGIEEMEI